MKPNYARASQIASLVVPLIVLLLCISPLHAADYSQRISEIDQKIAELEAQKSRALKELRKGLFCSECKRTASEIERTERVSFEQHLNNVKGDAIPASNDVINRKAREYDQRIEALQRERHQLLNQQRQQQEREEMTRRNQLEAQRQAAEAALRQQQQQQQQQASAERARQTQAATAKQNQRLERAQGLANTFMEGFNRANDQNKKWDEFQETRRERERQWERDYDELERQQAALEAAEAAARRAYPEVCVRVRSEREEST